MEKKQTCSHNAYYQRTFYQRRPEKKQEYRLKYAIKLVTQAGYVLSKPAAPATDVVQAVQ